MDMLELWKCGYYICWLGIMFLGRNHWFPTNYGSVNIMKLGMNQSKFFKTNYIPHSLLLSSGCGRILLSSGCWRILLPASWLCDYFEQYSTPNCVKDDSVLTWLLKYHVAGWLCAYSYPCSKAKSKTKIKLNNTAYICLFI